MIRKAIVIGATGMVGSQLVKQLLDDVRFKTVTVFVRRSMELSHPKLKEQLVDFNQMEDWAGQIQGDVLFSALGTTLKTAGSKKKQYLIDYTYQYQVAEAASQNGVDHYVLISSAGASANSRIFYSRMKGELDEAVKKLAFKKIVILRPSILEGDRKEKRPGETFFLKTTHWFTQFAFKKYRPIKDEVVARAMINAITSTKPEAGYFIYEPDEIFQLAEE